MKTLKTLIKKADILHKESLDERKDEDTQDQAYKEYWNTLRKIAETLQAMTNNAIDDKTAIRMAAHKRNEIISLLKKSA